MAAKTISGVHTAAVTLGNPTYNPAYVAGTIAVGSGAALTGEAGTAWTITNAGQIGSQATGTGGYGIVLESGGTVSNLAGGLIGTGSLTIAVGTRIATEHGEVPVERLAIGDRAQVVLGRGGAPVLWIGQRRVDCRRHPRPSVVWPVRIAAAAFGPGRPHRDLHLSPDHAIHVLGVLIPVKHLINGTTIEQVQVDEVACYHVELPHHDVLLAEGLAVESYIDTGDRANFANGGLPVRQFADFSPRTWEAYGCAPLVVTGPQLDAARRLVRKAEGLCPLEPR